jgi:hypothetical protein
VFSLRLGRGSVLPPKCQRDCRPVCLHSATRGDGLMQGKSKFRVDGSGPSENDFRDSLNWHSAEFIDLQGACSEANSMEP